MMKKYFVYHCSLQNQVLFLMIMSDGKLVSQQAIWKNNSTLNLYVLESCLHYFSSSRNTSSSDTFKLILYSI